MNIQNQGETTTSPWGINPKVKHLVEALDMKIPLFGKLNTSFSKQSLEKFRRAQMHTTYLTMDLQQAQFIQEHFGGTLQIRN